MGIGVSSPLARNRRLSRRTGRPRFPPSGPAVPSGEHSIEEDLHTICTRPASLLDPRELPWCATRAKARRGIGGMGRLWHAVGSFWGQVVPTLPGAAINLSSPAASSPAASPWSGAATGPRHISHASDRAGHNESSREAAAPVPPGPLCRAGVPVPRGAGSEAIQRPLSRGRAAFPLPETGR